MPDVLLGLDVGTTAAKAVLVSLDGRELAHGRTETPWRHTGHGVEADPHALVDAALAAAARAVAALPGAQVVAVGVAGMAETGVLIDREGRPTAPAIAWYDQRGAAEMADAMADLGEDTFVTTTGLPATPLCSLAKILWLRARSERARAGVRWLNVPEWIVRSLGGGEVSELSLASRTGFLATGPATPFAATLGLVGAEALLAELVEAGTPAGTADADRVPEWLAGATLAVAGHDHLCASVGAGAAGDDDLFDSHGTAEAFVRAVVPVVSPDRVRQAVRAGVEVGRHVVPGRQCVIGAVNTGLALERVRTLLGVAGDDRAARAALDRAAFAADPAAAPGLRIHGMDGPLLSIDGIGDGASPGALWRAAAEAAADATLDVLATFAAVAGPHARLVSGGGWAANPVVRAAKADRFGSFERATATEAGALGAALIAGRGAGLVPAIPTASTTSRDPVAVPTHDHPQELT